MEECRQGLSDLLLEGDLGAVALGLEQGLFSLDELDLPHNSDGSTPLISACKMGLKTVMHFLLERGADATLCNHSSQTALHVSSPDLQEELLAAIVRPLSHKGQLLGAAWRGDISALEHLLTDNLVDVNTQNRDGLTALMLAVREVDLFEGLKDIIPWDYNPTETVKALLALSASLEIQDQRGYTVLHYASQIRTPIKNEILQNISNSPSQSVPTHVEPQCHFPTDCCTNSLSRSPPPAGSVLECTKVRESHGYFNKDKITLFFHSSMEPKRSTRSGPSQLSRTPGWTSSLPNLQDRSKCWDKLDTQHSSPSEAPLKSSLIPVPPRLAKKSKNITESPVVPHLTYLSQSAPSLALLDASVLLQVRENIYNRLSGLSDETDSDNNRQKAPPPILSTRTPKHLAPLDRKYRDCPAFSRIPRPLVLKPISSSPAVSVTRHHGGRFSRQTMRGSRGARRGSAESASSSSCSSESSVDLDEEEEEEEEGSGPQELQQMLSTLLRRQSQHILESPLSSEQLENLGRTDIVEDNHSDDKDTLIRAQFKRSQEVEALMSHESMNQNEDRHSVDFLKKDKTAESVETSLPDLDVPRGSEIVPRPLPRKYLNQYQFLPENATTLYPASEENAKHKTTKSKGKKCLLFHTNQSFNILAHRNTNWGIVQPKRHRRHSSTSTQAKTKEINSQDHIVKGEATRKPNCPSMPSAKQSQKLKKVAPLSQRKAAELQCEIQINGDKKTLNKCHTPKELHNRELKTARQPKKPGNIGTVRAKSALDSVSYSDMFMQIHKEEDKGPAIFEMFATPLYENLREGRCAEKTLQVQPPTQVKRPLNGQRVQKCMDGNRRKQTQKCSITKSKPRKRRDSQPSRSHKINQSFDINKDNAVEITSPDGNCQILRNESDKGDVFITKMENEGPILSVIKEVLSTVASIHHEQRDSATSYQSALHPRIFIQTSDEHKDNQDVSNKTEDVVLDKFPAEPLINTWTSSRTRSPVYQKFLDEVGEGPVTDDLLRCLAEELISLEEKEVETLRSEHTENNVIITDPEPTVKSAINEDPTWSTKKTSSSDKQPRTERSCKDDTITWAKGEVLGRGAYGTVYCGLTSQGQLIAVKQVLLDVSTSETAEREYSRLEREVDLLKNLEHPNIVGFLGTALTDNVISIFMEYVPGGSISSVLNRFGPLPEKVFTLYTRQVLEGVAYLHENRVIHRDLKGNNLMLMPTGVVKLIDFGCARRLNRLTHSGGNSDLLKSVHGTPYWMAPEVINETGHGKKSDIWSIGCTVFEMATGKPPLAHMGKMAALFYIGARKGLMPPLPDDFSEEAKSFVKACLISNQKQRPSAADLLRHPFISHLRQPKSSKPSLHPNHSN
ncbi:mitogen-activated protein kinase kinase kinase 19 [Astyanax mexicanus]|uniref:mitogen-activated protein kinase kinase kinase 19 n=1 Tax=Astyanax mexicanus TaxID=7994 RepID=UPI0020CACE4B|nr:mitogen-activated protein kinase kinase kinase 19 [Astyanax mexicanus]XP_049340702.1 mitogen-activated protein kinase kinase kinase 19 [Astyanax mexicanus]